MFYTLITHNDLTNQSYCQSERLQGSIYIPLFGRSNLYRTIERFSKELFAAFELKHRAVAKETEF